MRPRASTGRTTRGEACGRGLTGHLELASCWVGKPGDSRQGPEFGFGAASAASRAAGGGTAPGSERGLRCLGRVFPESRAQDGGLAGGAAMQCVLAQVCRAAASTGELELFPAWGRPVLSRLHPYALKGT